MNPYRIAALVAEISGREVEIYENVAPHTYEVIIRPGSSNVDLAAVVEEIYKVKQSQKHVRVVLKRPCAYKYGRPGQIIHTPHYGWYQAGCKPGWSIAAV